VDVTDDSFADVVLGAPVPVIVDFWAPWCRPCEAVDRHLQAIAEGHGDRVRLVRMNVDENVGVPSRYGVLSLPTVILVARGETCVTVFGAHARSHYERAFAPHI